MRVLMASSELAPLVQTGGLGDAVAGLSRALARRGHQVTCVLPAYRDVLRSKACPDLREGGPLAVDVAGGRLEGRWLTGELAPGIALALVDIRALFDRNGIYGDQHGAFGDNPLRHIVLSRAAAYRVDVERPDALVAHDHHAALSVATLRTALDRGRLRAVGAVQVVHNNAYQGRCDASLMGHTGLPRELFHPEGVESWGALNLLKCGVVFADRVVAVSPTYAQEIKEPARGEGLDGAYRARAHRVVGIANGIDTARFDPARDDALIRQFSKDAIEGKAACRAAILDGLGLAHPDDGLFCVAVGRFAEQKGWDVLARALPALVARGATVALLGDGDPRIAAELTHHARLHPRQIAIRTAYDDVLARRLYAGADAVLVPSRFEPCGLVQLIAQRYGAVPVAHATGGLKDTICDAGDDDAQTGVLFTSLTPEALVDGVARVRALAERGRLAALRARVMAKDVSWDAPALAYERVLDDVVAEARARL